MQVFNELQIFQWRGFYPLRPRVNKLWKKVVGPTPHSHSHTPVASAYCTSSQKQAASIGCKINKKQKIGKERKRNETRKRRGNTLATTG